MKSNKQGIIDALNSASLCRSNRTIYKGFLLIAKSKRKLSQNENSRSTWRHCAVDPVNSYRIDYNF